MKRSLFRSRLAQLSSFTLVEMLVVIAIIAILAATVTVEAGSVIRSAKRTQAGVIANQIQTAVNAYYTEYSVYPIPSDMAAGTDIYIATNNTGADATHWKNLMYGLCGNINPATGAAVTGGTVSNTRNIAYMSPKKTDLDTNANPGVLLNPICPNSATGPYFNIAIDGNYDGLLGVTNGVPIPDLTQTNTPTTAVLTTGVAVWANCNTSSSTNNSFWVHTW